MQGKLIIKNSIYNSTFFPDEMGGVLSVFKTLMVTIY